MTSSPKRNTKKKIVKKIFSKHQRKVIDEKEDINTFNSQQFTTKNNASVVLTPIAINEMVSVFLRIKTGSLFEGQYLGSGISHLLEHSVFLGSEGYVKKDSFSAHIEQLGGIDLNAYTTYDHTAYYFSVFSKNLKRALKALSQFIFSPLLQEKDIANEMGTVISEMHMIDDRPSHMFYDFIVANMYEKLPYRFPIIGLKKKFNKLKPSDLKKYYESSYRSENMILSLAGNFESKKTIALVNETFGTAKNAKKLKPQLLQPVAAWKKQKNDKKPKCGETTHAKVVFPKVSLLYPGTHLEDACSVHLDLLVFFLTSGKGSFLYDLIKEKKEWVKNISSYAFTPKAYAPIIASSPPEKGYFSIHFELDNKFPTPEKLRIHINKIRTAIKDVLKKIIADSNPYSKALPKLLEAAKNNLIKEFLEEKESPMEIAASLTHSLHVYNHLSFEQQYLEAVRTASIVEIKKTINKYFIDKEEHCFLLLPNKVYNTGAVYENCLRGAATSTNQKSAIKEALLKGELFA